MKTLNAVETHQQLKARHSKEFGALDGIFWAFSNDQLEEGLLKVNASKADIMSLGAGGFIRKDCVTAFEALLARQELERKELKNDIKRLYDALVYELRNHEYCITYDASDALSALGLNKSDIDPELLKKACKESLEGGI